MLIVFCFLVRLLKEIILEDKFVKFKNLIKKEGTLQACNRCGWLKPK